MKNYEHFQEKAICYQCTVLKDSPEDKSTSIEVRRYNIMWTNNVE